MSGGGGVVRGDGAGTNAGGTDAADSNGRRAWVLAIDTATSRIVVAAATPEGELLGVTTWEAGRTHGEQLLPAIGRLHGEANLRRSRIRGVIVGTGPGAFTGLRVGLATAKALAHELGVPIVGVATGEALLRAAAAAQGMDATDGAARIDRIALLLPAGPNDRHLVRHGAEPRLLPGGEEPELGAGDVVVAVDLSGRAPEDALVRGEAARAGLAAALVALGVPRLAAGGDDLARLVPEYVSLPRGVRAESGEVAWSRDPR
ncbi:MAG TPA: tRNA (adenosine(37)-N6)-threonylcarbamoyltransferase complex dimerization subunit type 1 TsaB [Candidatus Limnocylindrales bacterium]